MKIKHFNNFNILVIWYQMSGVSLFLNCACVLATTKGEEEERRKGFINRVGKRNEKQMERRRQHLRRRQFRPSRSLE